MQGWRLVVVFFAVVSFAMCQHGFAQSLKPSQDSSDIKITLERGMCFGTCPAYKVEIYGDGRVVFTSTERYDHGPDRTRRQFAYSDGVLLPGVYKDQISPKAVHKLVESFKKANFFGLKDRYAAEITDHPTYELTFRLGKREKKVVDYVGTMVGMPQIVTRLENAVDKAAMSDRWVGGTPDLIDWLVKERFDFHSEAAGQLAAAAAAHRYDNDTLVVGLIERGAPLGSSYKRPKEYPEPGEIEFEEMGIAQAILEGAIKQGKVEAFNRVAKSEWFAKLDKKRASYVFAKYAAACSANLVDAVSAAGIEIDASTPREASLDESNVHSRTALSAAAETYGLCYNHEDRFLDSSRLRTLGRLLAHHADPNHRDSKGQTPIFHVQTIQSLRLLLAAGADANVVDKNGFSPVFWVSVDEVALMLIKAGASPAGIDENCWTLLDWAKERKMPKLSNWLLAHQEEWKDRPETKKACTPSNL